MTATRHENNEKRRPEQAVGPRGALVLAGQAGAEVGCIGA